MDTSFETLIRRIDPKLHGIAHKLNGRFTYFSDEDLYQEALGHLWIDHRVGKLADKTDSYVLQGCYFYLKNYIRTALDKAALVSIDALTDEDGPELIETIPDTGQGTEENADEALLAESLSRISLTDREKGVLEMLLRGMTTREIGACLGVSHVMIVKIRKGIERKCARLRKSADHGYHA